MRGPTSNGSIRTFNPFARGRHVVHPVRHVRLIFDRVGHRTVRARSGAIRSGRGALGSCVLQTRVAGTKLSPGFCSVVTIPMCSNCMVCTPIGARWRPVETQSEPFRSDLRAFLTPTRSASGGRQSLVSRSSLALPVSVPANVASANYSS